MNRITLLLCIVFLSSCENRGKKSQSPPPPMVEVTGKLEKLLSFPQDTVLEFYDLSGDFIMDFPDLSAYTITSLNLSHNYLDTVVTRFWPKGMEALDLSYNYLRDLPSHDSNRFLKEVNLSHNYIKRFDPYFFIERLDLSNNNLYYVFFYWSYKDYYYYYYRGSNKKPPRNMSYLNISNNPHLSNEVWFVPSMIDTIIHDNIANDKELKITAPMLKKMRWLRGTED